MVVIEKQNTRIQEQHKHILKNLALTRIFCTMFSALMSPSIIHRWYYYSYTQGYRSLSSSLLYMLPLAFRLICMYISMSTIKQDSHFENSIPVQVQNEWCLAMCNRRLCMHNTWHNGPCCRGARHPRVLCLPYLSGKSTGLFDIFSKTSVL